MTGKRIALLLALASLSAGALSAATPPAESETPLLLAQVNTLYGKKEANRVEIDIKPGSESNEIPIKIERNFPIAIFGSTELDITLVNPRTIRVTAADKKLVGRSDVRTCRREDINADTHADLICVVKTVAFRLEPGELILTLEAETYQRQPLRGEGTILIVDN